MEKVRFTEEKATMLATLYGRALDNRREKPILGDQAAEAALRQIDYNFAELRVKDDVAVTVAVRAKVIDEWAAQYLLEHPDAIVLHLGCGMDSRVFRLDPPTTVTWFDIDYPDVIDLRRKIYPDREGYQTIGTPITAFGWLDHIPSDRPALIVAEGLTMYLKPDDGAELLRRLVAKFPTGQLICDVFSRLGIKLQKTNPVVRRSGSTLYWGVDDPAEFEQYGLHPITSLDASEWAEPDVLKESFSDVTLGMKLQLFAIRFIPAMRRIARIGRWSF
ncbi:class I SAM-dependent methyltransferase [Nocardia sp. NBC_01009]|uniref:class I SAM-dependent methyltransferase n=1 Tax=Nocardia sp. NBC_01009 TaxID=2975996 RepID=UPI00386C4825|nr:class I SAM-dependent methyltransferase [Nocardia sp. NBC_01009]